MRTILTLMAVGVLAWVAISTKQLPSVRAMLPQKVIVGDTLTVFDPTSVSVRNTEPIITPESAQECYSSSTTGFADDARTVCYTRPADTLRFGEIRGLHIPWAFVPEPTPSRVVVLGESGGRVLVQTVMPMPGVTDWIHWTRGLGVLKLCPAGTKFFLDRSYFNQMAYKNYSLRHQEKQRLAEVAAAKAAQAQVVAQQQAAERARLKADSTDIALVEKLTGSK